MHACWRSAGLCSCALLANCYDQKALLSNAAVNPFDSKVIWHLCTFCRPTGSLFAPAAHASAAGPVTSQPQIFLTLTFSQPVNSVSASDIHVTLAQAAVAPSQVSALCDFLPLSTKGVSGRC